MMNCTFLNLKCLLKENAKPEMMMQFKGNENNKEKSIILIICVLSSHNPVAVQDWWTKELLLYQVRPVYKQRTLWVGL